MMSRCLTFLALLLSLSLLPSCTFMSERWNRLWGNEEEVDEEKNSAATKKPTDVASTGTPSSSSDYDSYLPTGMTRPPLFAPEYEGTTPVYERPGIRSPDVTRILPLNLNGTSTPAPEATTSPSSTVGDTTAPSPSSATTPADTPPPAL